MASANLCYGHWSLVIGHWSLVIGHWSFVGAGSYSPLLRGARGDLSYPSLLTPHSSPLNLPQAFFQLDSSNAST
ncbi:hypothetical protein B7486_31980 [cyanobacterium TDX16]|nr:hypothetical protein B7486_31980 [cyanobacterium TDX16]